MRFSLFSTIITLGKILMSLYLLSLDIKGKSKAKIQISQKAEYYSNLRNYLFIKLEGQIEIQKKFKTDKL